MNNLPAIPKIHRYLLAAFLLATSPISQANTADFATAKQLYEDKKYQQAYLLFNELAETDYASLEYSFYLAQSAAAIGKISEAIIAYERVLINHPSDTRSKLEIARLYYELGEYSLAREYFALALEDKPPQTVISKVKRFLTEIDGKTAPKSFTGVAIIGFGQDSNINSAPSASSWTLPVFDLEFNNTTEQASGLFHHYMLSLNHLNKASNAAKFDINNNLLIYKKLYPSHSDYNLLYLRYKPSLVFQQANDYYQTGLALEKMQYGADAYLNSYGIYTNASKTLNRESAFKAELKVSSRQYLRTVDKDRDALLFELSNHYYQQISPRLSWQATLDLLKNNRQSGELTDVSYQALRLDNTLNYQLKPNLKLAATFGLAQTHYQHKNAFFLNKRKDQALNFTLDLNHAINKDLSVQVRAEHSAKQSNQEAFEYNKNVFLVNLIQRF